MSSTRIITQGNKRFCREPAESTGRHTHQQPGMLGTRPARGSTEVSTAPGRRPQDRAAVPGDSCATEAPPRGGGEVCKLRGGARTRPPAPCRQRLQVQGWILQPERALYKNTQGYRTLLTRTDPPTAPLPPPQSDHSTDTHMRTPAPWPHVCGYLTTATVLQGSSRTSPVGGNEVGGLLGECRPPD